MSSMSPIEEFRKPEALRISSRRLEHLATLGLELHDKCVLELGAGIGELTSFWLDRGCRVVSLEAREENAAVYREQHKDEPRAEVRVADLDDPPAWDETFDVVFAYGVLYHLAEPAAALRWMAERCSGYLVMSTCVSLGDEDRVEMEAEYAHCPSQAVSGSGCRPTRTWVLNRLRELFPEAYQTETQPDHPDFPKDWSAADGSRLTRAVFVAKR